MLPYLVFIVKTYSEYGIACMMKLTSLDTAFLSVEICIMIIFHVLEQPDEKKKDFGRGFPFPLLMWVSIIVIMS